MNFFKKLFCAASVVVAMASGASAATVMNDWVFNPAGTGFAAGKNINEYLDITGNAFINLSPTSATTFNFTEHAVFRSPYGDNGTTGFFTNPFVSATFVGSGSGTFNGSFTFNAGGLIKIYSNPIDQFGSAAGVYGADQGTLIATFVTEAGGGGQVDGTGDPTGNGEITVLAKATTGMILPGYFFNGAGDDLAFADLMSFAFSNANTMQQVPSTLVNEVACQFAGFAGPGCNGNPYTNVPGDHFFVSNNGQFKIAAEVPEPGSLALFGLALLAAGVVSRKRAVTKA